jgi:serine/threonine protein kinase
MSNAENKKSRRKNKTQTYHQRLRRMVRRSMLSVMEQRMAPYMRIKRGAYGTIRIVNHAHDNKREIIKCVDAYCSTSLNELCFLQTFTHPNIIKMYDFKRVQDKLYIRLEYGGMTLLRFFECLSNQHRPQNYLDIFETIFRQIIRVLKYLNTNSIVHGDLSPNNILIDVKTLTVKLIDFGSVYLDSGIKKYLTDQRTKWETYHNEKLYLDALCCKDVAPPENETVGITPVFDIFSVGASLLFVCDNKPPNEFYSYVLKRMTDRNYKTRITIDELINLFSIKLDKKYDQIPVAQMTEEKEEENYMSALSEVDRPSMRGTHGQQINLLPAASEAGRTVLRAAQDQQQIIKTYGDYKTVKCIYDKYININMKMRNILVQWMYDVCLVHHRLFLFVHSIYLLDKFMCINTIQILRKNLQGIGITCLKISSMIHHIDVYDDYYVRICAGAYTKQDLEIIEQEILNVLKYKLYLKTFDHQQRDKDEQVNYERIKEIVLSSPCLCQEQLAMIYDENIIDRQ